MERIDKVITLGIILAAAGIVGFLIAGFKGNLDVAAFSFFLGGAAACVAVLCIGLKSLRRWRCGF